MHGQFLYEYLMPAGLPELYDIGKRVMARFADDVREHFPNERVTSDVPRQVTALIAEHPHAAVWHERHGLVLEWFRRTA